MRPNLWVAVALCFAYCSDKGLWKALEYRKEQARVLKEQQKDERRLMQDVPMIGVGWYRGGLKKTL
jgi:hypothetical protein